MDTLGEQDGAGASTFPTSTGSEWDDQVIVPTGISKISTFPTPNRSTQGRSASGKPDNCSAEDGKLARAKGLSPEVEKVGMVGKSCSARAWFSHPDGRLAGKVGKGEASLRFLSEHGLHAAGLGWSTLDLFGVDPRVGVARVSCCGALLVNAGSPVESVSTGMVRYRLGCLHRPHVDVEQGLVLVALVLVLLAQLDDLL
jgi:hypothetical protein